MNKKMANLAYFVNILLSWTCVCAFVPVPAGVERFMSYRGIKTKWQSNDQSLSEIAGDERMTCPILICQNNVSTNTSSYVIEENDVDMEKVVNEQDLQSLMDEGTKLNLTNDESLMESSCVEQFGLNSINLRKFLPKSAGVNSVPRIRSYYPIRRRKNLGLLVVELDDEEEKGEVYYNEHYKAYKCIVRQDMMRSIKEYKRALYDRASMPTILRGIFDHILQLDVPPEADLVKKEVFGCAILYQIIERVLTGKLENMIQPINWHYVLNDFKYIMFKTAEEVDDKANLAYKLYLTAFSTEDCEAIVKLSEEYMEMEADNDGIYYSPHLLSHMVDVMLRQPKSCLSDLRKLYYTNNSHIEA